MTITIPELQTERLVLRMLEEEDAEDIYAYCRDDEVARLTSWSPHCSTEDARAFLERMRQVYCAEVGRVHSCWGIRRGGSPVIGAIEFHQAPSDTGHIDYVLSREYWGKGIMSEAAAGVIAWAFAALSEMQTVRSCALAENVGSTRVMEKCGMTLAEKRKVFIPKFGEEREGAFYALGRDEWQRTKRRIPW